MAPKNSKVEPMQVVAHNLRRLRLEANLSQVELAERAGLDRTFVSLCERCHRNVTVQSLFSLAEGLGCEPASLLLVPNHVAGLMPIDARADPTARVRSGPPEVPQTIATKKSRKRNS